MTRCEEEEEGDETRLGGGGGGRPRRCLVGKKGKRRMARVGYRTRCVPSVSRALHAVRCNAAASPRGDGHSRASRRRTRRAAPIHRRCALRSARRSVDRRGGQVSGCRTEDNVGGMTRTHEEVLAGELLLRVEDRARLVDAGAVRPLPTSAGLHARGHKSLRRAGQTRRGMRRGERDTHRKLVGSRRNVISRLLRNLFMPVRRLSGLCACVKTSSAVVPSREWTRREGGGGRTPTRTTRPRACQSRRRRGRRGRSP